jgi:hypothetical protein
VIQRITGILGVLILVAAETSLAEPAQTALGKAPEPVAATAQLNEPGNNTAALSNHTTEERNLPAPLGIALLGLGVIGIGLTRKRVNRSLEKQPVVKHYPAGEPAKVVAKVNFTSGLKKLGQVDRKVA